MEDYEYDVTESLEHYDWAELIPVVLIYTSVFVLGICGNVLIIFTIARYRRFKNITNIFLASLSSADLLLVTVCIPVNVAKLFSYTWTFGVFLCKFVHYMQNVSAICSVLTLTAMSIERYYAIVHPMRAQYLCTLSQARKVITGIWIASFVLAIPTMLIQIQLPVGERVPAFWCVRDWERPLAWQIYELYMLVLILVIPLIVMAGAYGTIGREIYRVTNLRSVMTNEPVTCCGIPACGNKTDEEDHQHYSAGGSPVIGADGIMITDDAACTTGPDPGVLSAVEASTTLNNVSAGPATASHQIDEDEEEVANTLNTPNNQEEVFVIEKEVADGHPTRNNTDGVKADSSISRSSSIQVLNGFVLNNGPQLQQQLSNHQQLPLQSASANNTSGHNGTSTPSQRLLADHRIARKVVKMLVAVVVLFTVCWSPYLIDNVLMSFQLLPGARTGALKHMRIAFHLLSYMNSCCNPFVYGFMSRNFRRGFKAALGGLRPRSDCYCRCFCCICGSCRVCRRPGRPRQRFQLFFSDQRLLSKETLNLDFKKLAEPIAFKLGRQSTQYHTVNSSFLKNRGLESLVRIRYEIVHFRFTTRRKRSVHKFSQTSICNLRLANQIHAPYQPAVYVRSNNSVVVGNMAARIPNPPGE